MIDTNTICAFGVLISSLQLLAVEYVDVHVKVLGENHMPISEAKVAVTFEGYQRHKNVTKRNLTDPNGEAMISGLPKGGGIANLRVKISKDDYYDTIIQNFDHTKKKHMVTAVIREIGKPVPLYAKKTLTLIPGFGKKYGFDLEASDWVEPDGRGDHLDIYFYAEKVVQKNGDYRAAITASFPHELDGIQELVCEYKDSEFHTIRQAPESKYLDSYKWVRKKTKESGYEGSSRESQYVIRLRSISDEEGRLMSAHYAKLKDAIRILVGKQQPEAPPGIIFTYYFNPTPNDRNLEFDPKRNLFGDLSWEQRVSDP